MRLAYIDFEATGLNTSTDEVTEVALIVKDSEMIKPLCVFHAYVKIEGSIPEEIKEMTHIDETLLSLSGIDKNVAFAKIAKILRYFKVEHLIAHNGRHYDFKLLERYVKELEDSEDKKYVLSSLNYIDTMTDVMWPFKTRSQSYIATELGFINPFPHDALMDSFSLSRIVETSIKNKIIPSYEHLILMSHTKEVMITISVDFNNKDVAKNLNYNWDSGKKIWTKLIKETLIEMEQEKASKKGDFKVSLI